MKTITKMIRITTFLIAVIISIPSYAKNPQEINFFFHNETDQNIIVKSTLGNFTLEPHQKRVFKYVFGSRSKGVESYIKECGYGVTDDLQLKGFKERGYNEVGRTIVDRGRGMIYCFS